MKNQKKGSFEEISFKSFYNNMHLCIFSDFSLVGAKVIIEKLCGEVSLMEKNTIENVS